MELDMQPVMFLDTDWSLGFETVIDGLSIPPIGDQSGVYVPPTSMQLWAASAREMQDIESYLMGLPDDVFLNLINRVAAQRTGMDE